MTGDTYKFGVLERSSPEILRFDLDSVYPAAGVTTRTSTASHSIRWVVALELGAILSRYPRAYTRRAKDNEGYIANRLVTRTIENHPQSMAIFLAQEYIMINTHKLGVVKLLVDI